MGSSKLAALVAIGITTKDRWQNLEHTLQQLHDQGLDELEIVVIDDGSSTPLAENARQRFPRVRFERFDPSQGYIAQRNRLIRDLKAPFYLSLDDDSFPATEGLAEAAVWFDEHPNVAVLRFDVVDGDAPPRQDLNPAPFKTGAFYGCAFLLRREIALKLGGFEERLVFYGEESEYSLRCLAAGYEIYNYPRPQIRHLLSSSGRNWGIRLYRSSRSYVLTCLWHYPRPIGLMRAAKHFPGFLYKHKWARPHCFHLLAGCVNGFISYLTLKKNGAPLTRAQFRDWEERREAQGNWDRGAASAPVVTPSQAPERAATHDSP